MTKNSWSASSAAGRTSANSHQPPAHSAASTSGSPIAATRIREASGLMGARAHERVEGVWGNREVPPSPARRRGHEGETWFPPRERAGGERRSSTAEAAAAAGVRRQGRLEISRREVRPVAFDEHELGVRELPEQEVRDAQLARGADEQVGIGHLGGVEVRGEDVLVDLPRLDSGLDELARRLDDLGPPAVVERDPEAEARVLGRLPLEARHLALQLVGGAVAAPDEANSHALANEIWKLAVDRLPEDRHERVDLVTRPRPVLCRKSVNRQRLDVEIDRRLDRAAERLRAGPVTFGHGKPATACPATVAVHDDRDRASAIGKLRLLLGGPRRPERADACEQLQEAAASDFHDLCFFSLEQLVDLVRVLVRALLDAILGTVLFVDTDLPRVDELLQVMHDVAADVADGDAPLLREVADDLHELLAPLLGQLWDREPDDLAVVRGLKPQVGLHDRLLDALQRRRVERLHGE